MPLQGTRALWQNGWFQGRAGKVQDKPVISWPGNKEMLKIK